MNHDWKERCETSTHSETAPEGWDAFVESNPHGHHEQCSAWGAFRKLQGWEAIHQIIRLDGKILAGSLLLVRRVKSYLKIGYVSRGPQFLSGIEGLAERALAELDALARRLGLTYLVIVPHYGAVEIPRICAGMGYFPKPDPLPPSQVVTATLLVDLSKTVDELFAQLRATHRNYVRRGIKAGMELHEGGEADVETFRELMWQLCERRGVAPTPPQKDYFSKLWKLMGPSGQVRVLLGKLKGEPICAAFAFTVGNTVRIWKIGWTGTHEEARPNQFLWWSSIQWAKEKGFKFFDFVQIVPEHAQAILKGEPITGEYAGVTEFKLGFGGDLKILPDPVYRSFNPLLQGLLRAGGNRLLANPRVLSILNRGSRSALG